jgi:hypothetical protein
MYYKSKESINNQTQCLSLICREGGLFMAQNKHDIVH